MGLQIPKGNGQFLGLPAPLKSTGSCNRNHSIANNVIQQTRSFSMPGKRKLYSENFSAQVIRPIDREGVVGLNSAGEV